MTATTKPKRKVTTATKKPKATDTALKKTIDELATEVISGKWGNGLTTKQSLTAHGYNYKLVMKRVKELL